MGLRFSFDLFYPADQVHAGLHELHECLPARQRKRTARRPRPVREFDARAVLQPLTPDPPLFWRTALLFPADQHVRDFCAEWADERTEWDDEGNEYLPVGDIDVALRTGARYALFSYAAVTSSMSDLFERSRAIWNRFDALLRASGGLVGLFNGAVTRGRLTYPVLPDGHRTVTFDFFDFVLEERDTYWHLDVDRFAAQVIHQLKPGS
jgi:hypothetical protein